MAPWKLPFRPVAFILLIFVVPSCKHDDDKPFIPFSTSPSIAVFGSTPLVAWEDTASGRSQIYLKRWSGVAWTELGASASGGGISTTTGMADDPALVVDSSGNPIVAWRDTGSGRSEIYLRRWNGAAWVELANSASGGGVSNLGAGGGSAYRPALAIDGANNPVVSWEHVASLSSTWSVYLKHWNGSSWIELGGSATGSGIANSGVGGAPSVAVDGSNYPAVAWQDGLSGNLEIYLKRWNGMSWVELAGSATAGGVSNTAGASELPSLAIETTGNPVVGWQDGTNGNLEVYLKRWDGAQWAELSGSASSGGISGTATPSEGCSLALESTNNPLVAWQDGAGNTEVFLKRWDGAQWVQLSSSGSGNGLSNTSGASRHASLSRDASNFPVAAWTDMTSGALEVYLKRWDGMQWIELAGSASGGGVSN